ncbi:hypothetical protein HR12_21020 [Microbacterium sp. SUBG005]|nr:hypothetical protein HR12_21020 [Microbacterium sp. SUBG005]
MAKAMHALYFDPKDGGFTWTKTSQWNRDAYLNQARAALAVVDASQIRPRGTVADAEHREAVHRAVRVGIESVRSGDADRDVVRAVADQVLALEARS